MFLPLVSPWPLVPGLPLPNLFIVLPKRYLTPIIAMGGTRKPPLTRRRFRHRPPPFAILLAHAAHHLY